MVMLTDEQRSLNTSCMGASHQQVPANTPATGYRPAPGGLSSMDYQMRGVTPAHSEMSSIHGGTPRLHQSARQASGYSSSYLQPPAPATCREKSWTASYPVLPEVGMSGGQQQHLQAHLQARPHSNCMHEQRSMQSPSMHMADMQHHHHQHQHDALTVPHPRGSKRARSTSSQSSDFDIVSMIRYSPSALKPSNFAGSTRGSSTNGSPTQHHHFLGSVGHLEARKTAMEFNQGPAMHEPRMHNNFMMQQQQQNPEEQENNNPMAVYQAMYDLESSLSTGVDTGMANSMVITQPDPHMFNQAYQLFPQQPQQNMGFKQEAYDGHSQPMNTMHNLMLTNQNKFNNDSHSQAPPSYPSPAEMSPYNQNMSPYTPAANDAGNSDPTPADVIKQEPEEATAPEEHACEWSGCHTVFGERAELVTHIEKTHIEPLRGEEWTCLWADCSRLKKPFNARYKLLIHMRVHSGERPNKCTVRTSPLLIFLCGGVFCFVY